MNNSLVDDKIKELFVSYRTIAIVGVSADTNKASNRIMKFLRNTGYKIFPINPHTDNKIINGEKVYNNLEEIDDHVGIVNVFRPSEETIEIAKQSIKIGANVFWCQLGIHKSPELICKAWRSVILFRGSVSGAVTSGSQSKPSGASSDNSPASTFMPISVAAMLLAVDQVRVRVVRSKPSA